MLTYLLQAYLRDTAGSVADHNNKENDKNHYNIVK